MNEPIKPVRPEVNLTSQARSVIIVVTEMMNLIKQDSQELALRFLVVKFCQMQGKRRRMLPSQFMLEWSQSILKHLDRKD
jgi:hypothetical protein